MSEPIQPHESVESDDDLCERDRYDRIDEEFNRDEDKWTCCFPGECLMAGEHMRSECHTVEMVRQQFYQ